MLERLSSVLKLGHAIETVANAGLRAGTKTMSFSLSNVSVAFQNTSSVVGVATKAAAAAGGVAFISEQIPFCAEDVCYKARIPDRFNIVQIVLCGIGVTVIADRAAALTKHLSQALDSYSNTLWKRKVEQLEEVTTP